MNTRSGTPVKKCSVLLKQVQPKTPVLSKDLKKTIYEKKLLTTRTRRKIIDALDEIHSKSDAEQKERRRKKVISEIIDSEKSYLSHLDKIVNFFLKPIEEKRLLKPAEFDLLFGNIKTIYNINKTLLDELKKKDVAKAFSNIGPFLKLYSTHTYNYKKCLKLLQDSRFQNPQFSKFVESQESRPEVQSKLSALLITPIQRIPRYKLLLEELLNFTLPSHSDYTTLKGSLQKVINAAEHINTIVADEENAQRLLEIQRCMKKGEPNIIVPGRRLVKDGILTKMSERGRISEKMYVILTNDIIMYCKIKEEELKLNSLKCSSIYPINKCKVVEILDKGCFKVICQDQEIILYHKQLCETKEWIKVVRETIEKCVGDRKTLRKESSARRPVKRKDLNEYHDDGLSPGKPLKKRRIVDEIKAEESKFVLPPLLTLSKRKGIRVSEKNELLNKKSLPSAASRIPTFVPSVQETSEIRDDSTSSTDFKGFFLSETEIKDDKLSEAEFEKNSRSDDDDDDDTNMVDAKDISASRNVDIDNGEYEDDDSSEEHVQDVDMPETDCKEMMLYDKQEHSSSLTSKVGSIFGGIKSSVKKIFGFR